MTIFTHYLAATIGACIGFVACAFLSAGKDDRYLTVKFESGCEGCPYEHDAECIAAYDRCWKEMNA